MSDLRDHLLDLLTDAQHEAGCSESPDCDCECDCLVGALGDLLDDWPPRRFEPVGDWPPF